LALRRLPIGNWNRPLNPVANESLHVVDGELPHFGDGDLLLGERREVNRLFPAFEVVENDFLVRYSRVAHRHQDMNFVLLLVDLATDRLGSQPVDRPPEVGDFLGHKLGSGLRVAIDAASVDEDDEIPTGIEGPRPAWPALTPPLSCRP
jgi:hypothetical protein